MMDFRRGGEVPIGTRRRKGGQAPMAADIRPPPPPPPPPVGKGKAPVVGKGKAPIRSVRGSWAEPWSVAAAVTWGCAPSDPLRPPAALVRLRAMWPRNKSP